MWIHCVRRLSEKYSMQLQLIVCPYFYIWKWHSKYDRKDLSYAICWLTGSHLRLNSRPYFLKRRTTEIHIDSQGEHPQETPSPSRTTVLRPELAPSLTKRPGLPAFEFESRRSKSPIYLHSQMRDLAEFPCDITDHTQERHSSVCTSISVMDSLSTLTHFYSSQGAERKSSFGTFVLHKKRFCKIRVIRVSFSSFK